jgi:hypothetical protein
MKVTVEAAIICLRVFSLSLCLSLVFFPTPNGLLLRPSHAQNQHAQTEKESHRTKSTRPNREIDAQNQDFHDAQTKNLKIRKSKTKSETKSKMKSENRKNRDKIGTHSGENRRRNRNPFRQNRRRNQNPFRRKSKTKSESIPAKIEDEI